MNIDYVYLDLHIHTSENPDNLNKDYDLDKLIEKVKEKADGSECLISLTDHNTINTTIYDKLRKRSDVHFILGVELHISNTGTKPYHCHAYFKKNDRQTISSLNKILDCLYSKKEVGPSEYELLPTIDQIITALDGYDFVLVPHGGQSHSAFNTSIEESERCDTAVLRSIYYNQFEGFSSRNPKRTEKTIAYFKKLGIDSFVNLITGSDNYSPSIYPQTHSKGDSDTYEPTWMKSSPTFEGLRVALSENSRLVYSDKKPESPARSIEKVVLVNKNIDIDIELSDGLNVVIGGSSCGKTLLVDSIARKLGYSEGESEYERFGASNLDITMATQRMPHYITQNYILKVADEKLEEFSLEKLEIVKSIFPEDSDYFRKTESDAEKLRKTASALVTAIEQADKCEDSLSRIDDPSNLVVRELVPDNPIASWLPLEESRAKIVLDSADYQNSIEFLSNLKQKMEESDLAENCSKEFEGIIQALSKWEQISQFESMIHAAVSNTESTLGSYYKSVVGKSAQRNQEFKKLKGFVTKYVNQLKEFDKNVEKINSWEFHCCSREVSLKGHRLAVENNFNINKDEFLGILQEMYPQSHILPQLTARNIGQFFVCYTKRRSPKIGSYDEMKNYLNSRFDELRKRTYTITTEDGRDWKTLSAGWKTATILDLVFASEADAAPLIIDQPEDNLAADYLTGGLINAIKDAKKHRQIIAVTHSAAVPMLADAQTVVLCREIDGIITIRSGTLDGFIDNKPTLDWIADITDGGKKALRKRMKKYAMKDYSSLEQERKADNEN